MAAQTFVDGLGKNILPPHYRTLMVYESTYNDKPFTVLTYGGQTLIETGKSPIEVVRAFQTAFREMARQLEAEAQQPAERQRSKPQHSPTP
jgi:hypothetical protein